MNVFIIITSVIIIVIIMMTIMIVILRIRVIIILMIVSQQIQLLSCAPITGILHAAAVPDGNKKNHSMFYAVFVSDFCELNEIIPKPIRIL